MRQEHLIQNSGFGILSILCNQVLTNKRDFGSVFESHKFSMFDYFVIYSNRRTFKMVHCIARGYSTKYYMGYSTRNGVYMYVHKPYYR